MKKPIFNIGDFVYSKIYREADKGIIMAIIYKDSPTSPAIDYRVLFEDGTLFEGPEMTLSADKSIF